MNALVPSDRYDALNIRGYFWFTIVWSWKEAVKAVFLVGVGRKPGFFLLT
jgi:hypothetical protein